MPKHSAQLLEAYTSFDLVTLQRKDVQSKLNKTTETFLGDRIWSDFGELISQVTGLLEIGSQGWFLANFFRAQENGWALAAVCVLPQVARGLMYSDDFGGGAHCPDSRAYYSPRRYSLVRTCRK